MFIESGLDHFFARAFFTCSESSGYFLANPSSNMILASSDMENSGVVFFRYHRTAEIFGLHTATVCLLLFAPFTASPKALRFKVSGFRSMPLSLMSKASASTPSAFRSKPSDFVVVVVLLLTPSVGVSAQPQLQDS